MITGFRFVGEGFKVVRVVAATTHEINFQWFPAFLAFDYRLAFEFFQREGLRAAPEAVERLTRLLGHEPRSYEALVDETAKAWMTPLEEARLAFS